MLEFLCPTCGKRVQGDDSFAGKTVVCPGCNATITAPGAADPAGNTAIAEGAYPAPQQNAISVSAKGRAVRSGDARTAPHFRRGMPHI